MPSKDAIQQILDCSRAMFDNHLTFPDKKYIEVAIDSAKMLLQQNLLYGSAGNEIGVVIYGFNTDIQWTTIHDIKKLKLDFIREFMSEMKKLPKCEQQIGDIWHMLDYGIQTVNEHVGKKQFNKRIFLFTSGINSNTSRDSELSQVKNSINKINSSDIKLNIITFNQFDSLQENLENRNDQNLGLTQIQQNYKQEFEIFDKLAEKLRSESECRTFPSEIAIEIYRQFKTREVRTVTKFRGMLEISATLKIPVLAYTKCSQKAFPTLKKFSKVADNSSKDDLVGKICNDKIHFHHDDPNMKLIGKEDQIKGYNYGRAIIPISNEIAETMKITDEERAIKLLGFTAKENVPRHHNLSGVDIQLPINENEHAIAFNSFAIALKEMDKVGISRFTSRNNTTPKLVVLKPNMSQRGCCLYMTNIPTAEDLRDYQFPSLVYSTEAQKNLAAEFIASMDLMEFIERENDHQSEGLRPSDTYNPALQTLNLNLLSRAVDQNDDSGVQQLPDNILQNWYPERLMYDRNEQINQNFRGCFNLTDKGTGKEKKDRVYWRDLINNERVKLEQIENASQQQISNDENMVSNNKKANDFDDKDKTVREMSLQHPIVDFKDMITNKREDLVVSAIGQMDVIIQRLVDESVNGSHFNKAVDCLIAMRDGCLVEEEIEIFNEILIGLKNKYSKTPKKYFWELVIRKGITLISNIENVRSSVTEEEAIEFLKAGDSELKNVMEFEEDADLDYDFDLDDIE